MSYRGFYSSFVAFHKLINVPLEAFQRVRRKLRELLKG